MLVACGDLFECWNTNYIILSLKKRQIDRFLSDHMNHDFHDDPEWPRLTFILRSCSSTRGTSTDKERRKSWIMGIY